MSPGGRPSVHPRTVAFWCAAVSLALGAVYLHAAGAPGHMVIVNAAAFLVGLGALVTWRDLPALRRVPAESTLIVLAIGLLVTGIFGIRIDGVARWIKLGPVLIQPSLIVLPFMVVHFAHHRSPLSAAGLVIAALAMAVQPDRAMAGALVAALATQMVLRGDRTTMAALGAAGVALVVSCLRPDPLPPSPFVEGILYTSFEQHILIGLAVIIGAGLLIVPAFYGRAARGVERDAIRIFGVVWAAIILAAAMGNYPTPVVGYSGAAVLGYVLSIGALPPRPGAAPPHGKGPNTAASP